MLILRQSAAILVGTCVILIYSTTVSAQSSLSCSTSTVTIANTADATQLESCATFTGAIQLSTAAADRIALDQLQVLDGNLLIQSSKGMSSFSAGQLETVSGLMYLEDLPNLESLYLPKLSSVKGQLRLVDLPLLSHTGFGETLSTCPVFTVSNTGLTTLYGINPTGTTKGFNITDNKNLQGNLTFSTNAASGTPITIMKNGPDLTASFPNLTTAQRIDLANLSDVSLPLLTDAYELVLQSNLFQTFAAPRLESVGNSTSTLGVLLENNQGLTDVDFPALKLIGGLGFSNNSRIESLTLERLEKARKNIDLEGSFKSVSFPALQSAQTFTLKTSSPDFDCSPLEKYQEQGIIQTLQCDPSNGTDSSSSGSPSTNGMSTGAKAGVGIGVGAAVILIAPLSWLLYRKSCQRRRSSGKVQGQASGGDNEQEAKDEGMQTPPNYDSVASASSNRFAAAADKGSGTPETTAGLGVNELEAPSQVYELQASREFVELSGGSHRQLFRVRARDTGG